MGMSCMNSCSTNYNNEVANNAPDPKRFRVGWSEEYEGCCLLGVTYPNCTNYDGKKVLLVKGKNTTRTELDPHFAEDGYVLARFAPTKAGIALGRVMAKNYHLIMLFVEEASR